MVKETVLWAEEIRVSPRSRVGHPSNTPGTDTCTLISRKKAMPCSASIVCSPWPCISLADIAESWNWASWSWVETPCTAWSERLMLRSEPEQPQRRNLHESLPVLGLLGAFRALYSCKTLTHSDVILQILFCFFQESVFIFFSFHPFKMVCPIKLVHKQTWSDFLNWCKMLFMRSNLT